MFEDIFKKKITITTKVVDEWGKPLNANILIDRVRIAQTNYDGTVTIPGIADSYSEVRVTHVGYADYVVSAAMLPPRVILRFQAEELPELVLPVKPKKTVTTSESVTQEEKKPFNWLLWISVVGLLIQVKKYGDDNKKKNVVKTKI